MSGIIVLIDLWFFRSVKLLDQTSGLVIRSCHQVLSSGLVRIRLQRLGLGWSITVQRITGSRGLVSGRCWMIKELSQTDQGIVFREVSNCLQGVMDSSVNRIKAVTIVEAKSRTSRTILAKLSVWSTITFIVEAKSLFSWFWGTQIKAGTITLVNCSMSDPNQGRSWYQGRSWSSSVNCSVTITMSSGIVCSVCSECLTSPKALTKHVIVQAMMSFNNPAKNS